MATKKTETKAKSNTVHYTELKERATCCGKIYVSTGKPISDFTCKYCGQKLQPVKIPYVIEVSKS